MNKKKTKSTKQSIYEKNKAILKKIKHEKGINIIFKKIPVAKAVEHFRSLQFKLDYTKKLNLTY